MSVTFGGSIHWLGGGMKCEEDSRFSSSHAGLQIADSPPGIDLSACGESDGGSSTTSLLPAKEHGPEEQVATAIKEAQL